MDELDREIAIAKAEVHATNTDGQLEHFIEDRMRLAFDLGVAHAAAVSREALSSLLSPVLALPAVREDR